MRSIVGVNERVIANALIEHGERVKFADCGRMTGKPEVIPSGRVTGLSEITPNIHSSHDLNRPELAGLRGSLLRL
jgi:hypothetical protein